jgi:hypothetical protein
MDRYSLSSSSVSSASWSVVSDDEEDNAILGPQDGYDSDPNAVNSKSPDYRHATLKPSYLSYARRPSGTNNRPTVPLLHRRTSSGSSSSRAPASSRSVPSINTSSDDDVQHRGEDISQTRDTLRERGKEKANVPSSKPKRSRNRASLPAYFSLLATSGASNSRHHMSLTSAASQAVVTRPSPPTPRIGLSDLSRPSRTPPQAVAVGAPRGRRREPGTSRCSRRSAQSTSPSPSDSRSCHVSYQPQLNIRACFDNKGSVENVFDWASAPIAQRNRPHVRRNSSPIPNMMLSNGARGLDITSGPAEDANTGGGGERRGRLMIEELDWEGPVSAVDAPGYGSGRSGLKARERGPPGCRGGIAFR